MNIDKQLEVLRKALEKGAQVNVDFFNCQKDQAEEIAQEFSTLLNLEAKKWSGKTTDGIWVGGISNDIQITAYFPKEETENVG